MATLARSDSVRQLSSYRSTAFHLSVQITDTEIVISPFYRNPLPLSYLGPSVTQGVLYF